MASSKQSTRSISITTAAGEDLTLTRADYAESLGRPFTMNVGLVGQRDDIAFDDLVGTVATVRIEPEADGDGRLICGVITSFSRVAEGTDDGPSGYEATIEPPLALMSRTADCRIYQDLSVPDIIREALAADGVTDLAVRTTGTYPTRVYCVQYRETTLEFVTRLMREEGIWFNFEHSDGKCEIVLMDDPSTPVAFEGYGTLTYRRDGQSHGFGQVHRWQRSKSLVPGAFAHTSYDFETPTKDLWARTENAAHPKSGDHDVFDYDGTLVETADADRVAGLRLEAMQASAVVVTGATDSRGLVPGHRFTLEKHPVKAENDEYLVVESRFSAETSGVAGSGSGGGDFFSGTFSAIPATTPFRIGGGTGKPTVQGPQTAFVTGPDGSEIHTDKYGRVRLAFLWDRHGKPDATSSCWVRVSQGSTGNQWGGVSIPRVGQEVIVEFLDGDPDRPIVTGRVHNGDDMPPYALPDAMTRTVIRTSSSPGGKGFNELSFEDKKGEEHIFLRAEKDQRTWVQNDALEWIGKDRHSHVVGKRISVVDDEHHEEVKAKRVRKIGAEDEIEVAGAVAEKFKDAWSMDVTGDVGHKYKKNHSIEVTMNSLLKAMGIAIEGATGITIKCGGSSIVLDPAGVTIKGPIVTIDGAMTKINSGPGSPPKPGKPCPAKSPGTPDEPTDVDDVPSGGISAVVSKPHGD